MGKIIFVEKVEVMAHISKMRQLDCCSLRESLNTDISDESLLQIAGVVLAM